jgi:hypothetical protein
MSVANLLDHLQIFNQKHLKQDNQLGTKKVGLFNLPLIYRQLKMVSYQVAVYLPGALGKIKIRVRA